VRCAGITDADGGWCYCTREEYANGAKYSEKCQPPAYVHRREPDGSYRPWTEFPPAKVTPINRKEKQRAKSHTPPVGRRIFTYSETERVVRYDNADGSRSIHPENLRGNEWVKGYAPDTTRVYNRDLIAAAEVVDLVEGEPCADGLTKRGRVAVTWPGGTGQVGQALEQLTIALTGKHVVIHTDADAVGRQAMREIAMALRGNAASVKIVDYYADEESGKDLEDFFADGHSLDDLAALVAATPAYEPEAAPTLPSGWAALKAKAVNLAAVAAGEIPRPERLLSAEPMLVKGRVHCVFGGPGQAKSLWLLWQILLAIRAGYRVLFLDEETGHNETTERLVAMGATSAELAAITYLPYALPGMSQAEQAAAILAGIDEEGFDLIATDSMSKLLAAVGIEENDNTGVTQFMASWMTPAAHVLGKTVVFIDHTGKVDDDGSYSRGASSKLADVDIQWHVKATAPPNRTSMGRIVATCKKDRTATVPATVRYIVGGDGTGVIKIGLEATTDTLPITIKATDRPYLDALARGGNVGKTYTDWCEASGKSNSTFSDAVYRLKNAGAVMKHGDQYSVAPGVLQRDTDAPNSAITDEVRCLSGFSPAGQNRTDPILSGGSTSPPLGGGTHRTKGAAGTEAIENTLVSPVADPADHSPAGVISPAPTDAVPPVVTVPTEESPAAWVEDKAPAAIRCWAANARQEKTIPVAVQRFARQHGLDYDTFDRRTFPALGTAILAAMDRDAARSE
jgi:hypothetical protein